MDELVCGGYGRVKEGKGIKYEVAGMKEKERKRREKGRTQKVRRQVRFGKGIPKSINR